MDEEDERRVASGDIIGESSEIIAALKAEVGIVCVFVRVR